MSLNSREVEEVEVKEIEPSSLVTCISPFFEGQKYGNFVLRFLFVLLFFKYFLFLWGSISPKWLTNVPGHIAIFFR